MPDNSSSNTFMFIVGGVILAVILLGVVFLGGAFFWVSSSSTTMPASTAPLTPPSSSSSPALTARLVADPAQPGHVAHVEFNGKTYPFDDAGLNAITQAIFDMPGNVSIQIAADQGISQTDIDKLNNAIVGINADPAPVPAPATDDE